MKIVSETQREILNKKCVALHILDLFAGFDSIHQCLLKEIMKKNYGLNWENIQYSKNYSKERAFSVLINASELREHTF